MINIVTINPAEVITMTSLELVDYVNSDREEKAHAAGVEFPSKGFAKLEHGDLLKKVPEVLGGGVGNFSDTYIHPQNGQSYPMFSFPKREACLMAMSYSYELQAKVFDRMTALEQQASKPIIALPQTFAAALRLAAEQAERIELLALERDTAIATKAEIGSKREATAMNTASQAVKKAQTLEIELDRSKQYATVKRMEMLYHGQKFNWRLLKAASSDLGIETIKVFDQNYGTVRAYHADAWNEAYALSIDQVLETA